MRTREAAGVAREERFEVQLAEATQRSEELTALVAETQKSLSTSEHTAEASVTELAQVMAALKKEQVDHAQTTTTLKMLQLRLVAAEADRTEAIESRAAARDVLCKLRDVEARATAERDSAAAVRSMHDNVVQELSDVRLERDSLRAEVEAKTQKMEGLAAELKSQDSAIAVSSSFTS